MGIQIGAQTYIHAYTTCKSHHKGKLKQRLALLAQREMITGIKNKSLRNIIMQKSPHKGNNLDLLT